MKTRYVLAALLACLGTIQPAFSEDNEAHRRGGGPSHQGGHGGRGGGEFVAPQGVRGPEAPQGWTAPPSAPAPRHQPPAAVTAPVNPVPPPAPRISQPSGGPSPRRSSSEGPSWRVPSSNTGQFRPAPSFSESSRVRSPRENRIPERIQVPAPVTLPKVESPRRESPNLPSETFRLRSPQTVTPNVAGTPSGVPEGRRRFQEGNRPVAEPFRGAPVTLPGASSEEPRLRSPETAIAIPNRVTGIPAGAPEATRRSSPEGGSVPAPSAVFGSAPKAGSLPPLTQRQSEMVEALRSGRSMEWPRQQPGRARPVSGSPPVARSVSQLPPPPRLSNPHEASAVFRNVLGSPGDRQPRGDKHPSGHGGKDFRPGESGRQHLPVERQANVEGFVRQLRGGNPLPPSPPGGAFRGVPPLGDRYGMHHGAGGYAGSHWNHLRPLHPMHSHCNRALRFPSYGMIPPILLASVAFRTVYLDPIAFGDLEEGAYEVAYRVDPSSELSRDDILFSKGSTDFADELSYRIVEDLAYAMMDPSLAGMRFAIEGHASAEGSYEANLTLSQRRAERIAQEIVYLGVDPERLMPIGYGESEARYPADAPEELRRLDRRVVVYRLEEVSEERP